MRRPKIWMIRNGRILGVDSRRRGIEQMETFGATRAITSAVTPPQGNDSPTAKQPAGSGDGGQHSGGIEWFDRAQIDHFDFESLLREFPRPRLNDSCNIAL